MPIGTWGQKMGYRHAAIAALAASTFLASAPAEARGAAHYNIAAQDLGDALRAFGLASHQQIMFSENQVRGKRNAALTGTFTVEEGLSRLLGGTGLGTARTASGVVYITNGAGQVAAQTSPADSEASEEPGQGGDVVVTGSRIKQASNATAAPLTSFSRDDITERGFTQVGDMLNQITSNAPTFQVVPFAGYPVVTAGRQSPDLFNLGTGRTLSLINGRRTVPASSGVRGGAVDTNAIPVDLIDRVDVLEAGGAAVYGSDASAGVVNYVLKRDYQGISLDAQYGLSTRGDYRQPSLRFTAGRNFADGKGNITVSAEYSSTSALLYGDRPWSANGQSTAPNPLDTGPHDGISVDRNIFNSRFFTFNNQGIIYRSPFSDFNFSGDPSRMIMSGGTALQFSADGQTVVPYDNGTVQDADYGISSGGQGYSVADRSTLYAGTRRWTATALAHYDFSPALRLSAEFSYGRQTGRDPLGGGIVFKIMGAIPGSDGYGLFFNKTNPFLTPSEIATVSEASPSFAGGGSLLLSKAFENILPSRERRSDTETWRSVVSLDGDFSVANRNLYYSLSYSHGETTANGSDWEQSTTHLINALSASRNGAGQIVCSINAVTTTDAACVPSNPFSTAPISQAQRDYVVVRAGTFSKNVLDDVIASLGGSFLKLPGGDVKFSLAYEYRRESAQDTPYAADLAGLPYNSPSFAEGGSFHTNEYSAELVVPLVGRDFTLPLVKSLEESGSFRQDDNSRAGRENVWGIAGRWEVAGGLTLRGTIRRNFRAPTLDELIAPNQTRPSALFYDPCSFTNINDGPAPDTRRANCAALFTAHPGWGPLSTFVGHYEINSVALVTSGGNPNLKSETSKTKTFGAVWEPNYIPGLSVAVDVISVDLENGLVQFSPASFFTKCYDTSPQDGAACATFTRNTTTGYIDTAISGYANAGYIKFRGETYKLHYALPLDRLFSGNTGVLSFGLEATHTSKLEESDTGFVVDAVRRDGTVGYPDWRMRFDLNFNRGRFGLFYSLSYYPPETSSYYDTVEPNTNYRIDANSVSSMTVSYHFDHLSLRAGLTNIFDQAPSFPTFTYGDALGRRFFVGANVK